MKPKLEYGSHGITVSEAQVKLNVMMPNAAPLVVDGKFGAKTAKRVQEFQKSRGLAQDGIVGAKTWAALDGPGLAPTPMPGSGPKATWMRVRSGATLICECGAAPATLKINAKDREFANVYDSKPHVNISPFGMCRSFANPAVFAATSAAMGALTPMPCTPQFAGPWSPGSPIEMIGTPKAAALDLGSVVVCQWGGVVSIASGG